MTVTARAIVTRLRSRALRTTGWRDAAAHQAFLIPIIIVFVVLFLVPLAQSFYWSFTDFNGYSSDVNFVGLANYVKLFTDSSLLAGLTFTLLFAVGITVGVTMIAIPLAVALNKRFFGRNLARSVFFFPAVPSMLVLGLVWAYILSPLDTGALNTVLDKFGGGGPVAWLAATGLARMSVIVVGIWGLAGWHAVLYLAYLQSIPHEYYEAATIDGASGPQQFWKITLPLLTPAIVISQFLLLTHGLKIFDLPFALTGGGPGFATFTITQSIIVTGVSQGHYGLASALAVVFTLTVAVLAISQVTLMRVLERRVT
ncbi:carbohydrate ABC transporter permease [Demequina lutea]|uniref:Multiple sugar transport system permease protein/raffinose/stachyose/melibiose transport system permease protein n=1 Tax=Demequina lutea TaxID=431489 RepID=A0A7Y9ZCE0_9MICO|nr:sugar ABC transporter permease [Demequina lutea]NYI42814.1 multiple sugar transport system permease protein/raffinose/stachyose/melibiose transport system permease protein [Demequina lutea]